MRDLAFSPFIREAQMAHYVDGFVVPVPLDKVEAYRAMAKAAGKIWLEPRRAAVRGDRPSPTM